MYLGVLLYGVSFYYTVATIYKREPSPDGSSSQDPDKTDTNLRGETEQGKKTHFRLATPPADWEFRRILIKIAREMDDHDLKQAITLFRGKSRALSN